jgi:hypothetical protein
MDATTPGGIQKDARAIGLMCQPVPAQPGDNHPGRIDTIGCGPALLPDPRLILRRQRHQQMIAATIRATVATPVLPGRDFEARRFHAGGEN